MNNPTENHINEQICAAKAQLLEVKTISRNELELLESKLINVASDKMALAKVRYSNRYSEDSAIAKTLDACMILLEQQMEDYDKLKLKHDNEVNAKITRLTDRIKKLQKLRQLSFSQLDKQKKRSWHIISNE